MSLQGVSMTDKEYRQQLNRTKKIATKWSKCMGLNWNKINLVWSREPKNNAVDCVAEVDMSWEYQEYTVTYYLPKILTIKDDELETTIVHEFCHILMCPAMFEDTESGNFIKEHTTTTLQKAFMWVREGAKKGDL